MDLMINKFGDRNLRNAEYLAFVFAANDILGKYPKISDALQPVYGEFNSLLDTAKEALKVEEKNEKVREKNGVDRYRDRLHSKLFNCLKFILYDERDPRFDHAQAVMKVVKEVGNPNRLPEKVQSVMLAKLGNSLEPLRDRLEAIGAQDIVNDLMETSQKFIALETKSRETTAAKILVKGPSLAAVRREINSVYRSMTEYINSSIRMATDKEEYRAPVGEMNLPVARYESLLAARKREKKETKSDTNE